MTRWLTPLLGIAWFVLGPPALAAGPPRVLELRTQEVDGITYFQVISLYMTTNAALYCAWETGKLPASHEAALAGAGLRSEDVAVPEGKGCAGTPTGGWLSRTSTTPFISPRR